MSEAAYKEFQEEKNKLFNAERKRAMKYLRSSGELRVLPNEVNYLEYTSYLHFRKGVVYRETKLFNVFESKKVEKLNFSELKGIFKNREYM